MPSARGAGAHEFEDFLHLDDVAFQPVISAIEVTLRLPSDRRWSCTIRRMAAAIWPRIEAIVIGRPAMPISCSRREIASRGLLAWMVAIEPSWPVFMACSMSKASSPRHSPRMMRSGRMRSAFLTSSRWRISPLPSMLGGRVSMRADMRLLQLQFGGVLDGDQALLLRDEGRQRVEHRGLAGAGAAGDDRGDARLHGGGQQLRHLRLDRADLDQLVQVERLLGEFADRHQRAVDADRPHRDVDARAVEQARVAQRMRFIDPAADRGDDLVDDAQQMRLVLEAHAARLEQAAALDIDAFVAVDQDVADGRVLEQRLERAEPRHLVEDFGDEVVELLLIEREPLDQDVLRDELLDVRPHLVFGQLFQRREVDLLDQPAVQAHLGVEQLVGEQRIGRLRRRRSRPAPAPGRPSRTRLRAPGGGSSTAGTRLGQRRCGEQ